MAEMREDLAHDYWICDLCVQAAGPLHCEKAGTSMAKTWRSGSAWVERDERERAEAVGAAVELEVSGSQVCEVRAGARLGTTRSRQAEAGGSTVLVDTKAPSRTSA